MSGVSFCGARLRLARLFHGLSPAEVAERVGVTRQYIHSLEIGDRTPAGDLTNALAFVLHVSPKFFFNRSQARMAEEHFHFRSRKSTPTFARLECVARGAFLDELLARLDAELRFPKVDISPVEVTDDSQIEAIASDYRQRWGLGEGPISNMCRVLEQRAGAVITCFSGVSEKVDAFSISRPRPVVVRNPAKESSARMRFDLAHELGHLVLHYGIETGDDLTERQADRFAGAFLFPRRAFVAEFPRRTPLDWDALYALKKRWKVSMAAIVHRAQDLGLLDPAQSKRAYMYLSKTGQRKKERGDEDIPVEKPELLETALRKYEGLTNRSLSELAEDLGFKPLFLRRLAGLESIPVDELGDNPAVVKLEKYIQRRRNERVDK